MNQYHNVPALYHSDREHGTLGPAMEPLTPRERAVVWYLLDTGTNDYTAAAREAGYAPNADMSVWKVTGYRLRRDPKIAAAIVEEGRRRPNTSLPAALKTIETIAADPTHKDALKAATTIAAMSGIVTSLARSETHVVVTGNRLERIRENAIALGFDPDELIRGRMKDVTPRPPAIDLTPEITMEEAEALVADL